MILTIGELGKILKDQIARKKDRRDPVEIDNRAKLGGIFETPIRRHHLVQKAIEDGDPEKADWLRRWVFATGKHITKEGYEQVALLENHNLLPTLALAYSLNLLFVSATTRETGWYGAFFINDRTPDLTWTAGWAGGAPATAEELPVASYSQSARQALTFSATSTASIASATTTLTIATGVTTFTIYGITLNSSSTPLLAAPTTEILFAASAYTTEKTGIDPGSEPGMKYTFTIANV